MSRSYVYASLRLPTQPLVTCLTHAAVLITSPQRMNLHASITFLVPTKDPTATHVTAPTFLIEEGLRPPTLRQPLRWLTNDTAGSFVGPRTDAARFNVILYQHDCGLPQGFEPRLYAIISSPRARQSACVLALGLSPRLRLRAGTAVGGGVRTRMEATRRTKLPRPVPAMSAKHIDFQICSSVLA